MDMKLSRSAMIRKFSFRPFPAVPERSPSGLTNLALDPAPSRRSRSTKTPVQSARSSRFPRSLRRDEGGIPPIFRKPAELLALLAPAMIIDVVHHGDVVTPGTDKAHTAGSADHGFENGARNAIWASDRFRHKGRALCSSGATH